MSTIELTVNEIACTSCITKIKKGMNKISGIKKVEILTGSAALRIYFNENVTNDEKIYSTLQKLALRIFD